MKNIKPSELIRLAIHDLEVVEKQPDDYTIHMSTWHSCHRDEKSHGRRKCFVCLAGAVMAISMKAPQNITKHPDDYDPDQAKLFAALDRFRVGRISCALMAMGLKPRYTEDWSIIDYTKNPSEFKRQMRMMADFLEKEKL